MEDNKFKLAVFSIIPWFKVHEEYPMDGSPRKYKRRDLRKGMGREVSIWICMKPSQWVERRLEH